MLTFVTCPNCGADIEYEAHQWMGELDAVCSSCMATVHIVYEVDIRQYTPQFTILNV